jgi:hypothetical protein
MPLKQKEERKWRMSGRLCTIRNRPRRSLRSYRGVLIFLERGMNPMFWPNQGAILCLGILAAPRAAAQERERKKKTNKQEENGKAKATQVRDVEVEGCRKQNSPREPSMSCELPIPQAGQCQHQPAHSVRHSNWLAIMRSKRPECMGFHETPV